MGAHKVVHPHQDGKIVLGTRVVLDSFKDFDDLPFGV